MKTIISSPCIVGTLIGIALFLPLTLAIALLAETVNNQTQALPLNVGVYDGMTNQVHLMPPRAQRMAKLILAAPKESTDPVIVLTLTNQDYIAIESGRFAVNQGYWTYLFKFSDEQWATLTNAYREHIQHADNWAGKISFASTNRWAQDHHE